MPKIIFFTAAQLPTEGEIAAIAAIETAITNPAPYELRIRGPLGSNDYGAGPEVADFVAGTPPTEYDGVPVLEGLPVGGGFLTDEQAVVTDGQAIALSGTPGPVATAQVVNGELTVVFG